MIQKKCEASEFYSIFIIISLLLVGMNFITPIPVTADVSTTYDIENGTTLHNGTDLHMPQANISIMFNHRTSGDSMSISCEFEIISNTSQITSLAFVNPHSWLYHVGSNASFAYFIYQDGNPLNFTFYSWEELGWNSSAYKNAIINDYWLDHAMFSVFEVELTCNISTLISVDVLIWDFPWSNYIDFHYIVGTARTFDSDTHQRIHVKVIENEPLNSLYFYPNASLSVEKNGANTDAYWDFYIRDFEYDEVRFSAYVELYHRWTPTYPETNPSHATPFVLDPTVYPFAILAIVFVFGFVLVFADRIKR